MKKPKMVMFDYGQTLVNEKFFDGIAGLSAVLKYAVKNKYNLTPQQLFDEYTAANKAIGRFDPNTRHTFQLEIPNEQFMAYLLESLGIELSIPYSEIGVVFWDAAAPGEATEGMEDFLSFLKEDGIRTGVISNLSYSGRDLKMRINSLLPQNEFEFIISTADYVFRKPNKRIYDLALEKAELESGDVWFVGDQYKCDVLGALNCGMTPVWYTQCRHYKEENEHNVLEVASWNELKSAILSAQ